MATSRTRVFGTVVYPESAPKDWRKKLDDFHVMAFVSPLHDKDKNEGDESPKKPHYHVMVMFEGVKSLEQWHSIRDAIGGVGDESINSTRGYARYLCHLDNPEKFQYDKKDVSCFGGACYEDAINSSQDRYNSIREMIAFIRQYHIKTYAELLDYASENERSWFVSLCDNSSYVISAYIKSLRYEE